MRQKYGNKKVEHKGVVFDSKKERNRYETLLNLERAGLIKDLRRQVPFEIVPAVYVQEERQLKTKVKIVERCVQRAAHYVADFVYNDMEGNVIVEDTKGYRTSEYLLKKKMMRAFLGIEIKEV